MLRLTLGSCKTAVLHPWIVDICSVTPLDCRNLQCYTLGLQSSAVLHPWIVDICSVTPLDCSHLQCYTLGLQKSAVLHPWIVDICSVTPLDCRNLQCYTLGLQTSAVLHPWIVEICSVTLAGCSLHCTNEGGTLLQLNVHHCPCMASLLLMHCMDGTSPKEMSVHIVMSLANKQLGILSLLQTNYEVQGAQKFVVLHSRYVEIQDVYCPC